MPPDADPLGEIRSPAMLAALTDGAIDGASYDAELPPRQRATLY